MAGIWARTAAGTLAAAGISIVARRYRALSRGGAAAAAVVGGITVGGAGWRGGSALVAFFVSSTLLGRLPGSRRIEQQRGNERDAVQVLANGGVASALALAAAMDGTRTNAVFRTGFGGALAAAAADTWATEIGSRSPRPPRSILTWQPVRRGASGGVTVAGLLASAAGAGLIAGCEASGLGQPWAARRAPFIAVTAGGFAGSVADSLLGATVQAIRFCDTCGRETELRVHGCGAPTRHLRGLAWCDNDAVNLLATATGAVTAIAIAALLTEVGSRGSDDG